MQRSGSNPFEYIFGKRSFASLLERELNVGMVVSYVTVDSSAGRIETLWIETACIDLTLWLSISDDGAY